MAHIIYQWVWNALIKVLEREPTQEEYQKACEEFPYHSTIGERKMKTKIHGNGFIKIFLEDGSFIHIYSHNIPKQRVDTSIHDHRFSFKSMVLQGVLIHRIYDVIVHSQGDYYICIGAQNDKLVPTPTRVFLKENNMEMYMAGQSYSFCVGLVHRVEAPSGILTVTHMTKTQIENDYTPRIFAKVDSMPDNEFDNSVRDM